VELIPAIDIRGGRCVRLTQGDYARETVYDDDPADAARRWRDAGAPRLHVVDLDGAREGRVVNGGSVRRIVGAVDVPVQLGGGLRDLDTVSRYLEGGVERAILGTAAVKDRALLESALERFPGRVAVGVDARDGVVVTEGWLEASSLTAGELAAELAALGVPRIIYTDTLRDGTLTEPNFAALDALLSSLRGAEMRVVYSGGVSTVAQVRRLSETGVEGAIVGRALYTGDIDLREALSAAQT
jgi:phosphoribosylformimino-5-aminoimidazole carboxamide ribotide isomerase